MILAALAAAALSAPAPLAAVQDPLTFDQTVSCAAMFFVQSKQLTVPEEVEAFEMGMVEMITRAEGMNSGLTQDQIIEQAAIQADDMMMRIDAASDADAKAGVIVNWGPGMVACIDAVLA
ncbi:hypothetical protein [Brevundimonas sp.]|uniref:hypothetical protein n=1 Tax=Brevundimonas sp. TaxID=1871086 RepID=UPI002E158896|nr:hypothetical protein [Brevundimonas sp.]